MMKKKTTFKNWSTSVHCQDVQWETPDTLDALQQIVVECHERGKGMRVVGSGHSFTPLVATDEILLSIDQLAGVISLDEENHIASVWGGTSLKALGELLFQRGYAMENLGDINEQTIAGAISTGTHGTGCELGNIPTQVKSMTVMTAEGKVMDISSETAGDWLKAAQISLGLLGIIVKVDLKVMPAYGLLAESYRLRFDDCVMQLDTLQQKHRNMEFYWFPHTESIQVKTMDLCNLEALERENRSKQFFKDVVVENGLLWMLSETSRIVPSTAKTMSSLSAWGVPVGKKSGYSNDLYATPRMVKFQEMEYSVPVEAIQDVLRDIKHVIHKRKFNVHFPIECRFVQKDDIWLSPSFERDSAYIAVHMYKGMDFHAYFAAVEDIFQQYEGRPHWGKMHTLQADQLHDRYPKLDAFRNVRKQLDPNGMFVNEYLRRLLGI